MHSKRWKETVRMSGERQLIFHCCLFILHLIFQVNLHQEGEGIRGGYPCQIVSALLLSNVINAVSMGFPLLLYQVPVWRGERRAAWPPQETRWSFSWSEFHWLKFLQEQDSIWESSWPKGSCSLPVLLASFKVLRLPPWMEYVKLGRCM